MLVFLLVSLPAAAERYALLVGVSSYPHLVGVDLRGPKNDVQLMHTMLTARGFRPENVVVVADSVPAQLKAVSPTRQVILDAFDRLVAQLRQGDFLYVHFSGHGAQQPEREAGQEEDGLDEIFLARDTTRWDEARRNVSGAITDNELGSRLDRAAQRGAATWIVYDSCHAGTMTRATGSRPRRLLREQLGIPATLVNRASEYDSRRPASVPYRPRSVAFFASLPHTPTGEYRRSWLEGATVYGQFTYVIAEGLSAYPGMTYRQLGRYVLQRYGTLEGAEGGFPYFEGDLDTPVFGDGGSLKVRQWPVRRVDRALAIGAGALSLFSDGALFALLKDPRAPTEEAFGYARAISITLQRAELAPVAAYGKPRPALGEAAAEGVHARLLDPNLGFSASVSVRAIGARSGAEVPPDSRIAERLRSIVFARSLGPKLRPVTGAADIELWLVDGKIHVRAAGVPLVLTGADATPSFALPAANAAPASLEQFRTALLRQVHRAAKTINLLRVAQQQAPDDSDRLRVSLLVQRAGTDGAEPIQVGTLPSLKPGDTLFVEVENLRRYPVDITVLGIDARHEFVALYPDRAGSGNRILQNDRPRRIPAGGITLQPDAFGIERLIVVAAEQPMLVANAEGSSDFTFLAEDAFDRGAVTRAGSRVRTGLLVRAAGLEEAADRRGNDAPEEKVSVTVFTWRTLPPGGDRVR